MKRLGRKFWIFLSAFVLSAGIIVVVAACGDDEKCKTCTNKKTDAKEEFCGDDLIEALRPDSDWKNCK